jgi:hypothetical protein
LLPTVPIVTRLHSAISCSALAAVTTISLEAKYLTK